MDRLTRDVLVYSKIPRAAFKVQAVDMDRLLPEIVRQNLPDPSQGGQRNYSKALAGGAGKTNLFLAQSFFQSDRQCREICLKGSPAPNPHLDQKNAKTKCDFGVADNGIGILPEHQARVWGMFERIHPQHMYEGTGIGLAIVRKTVERMNGTMGLESDGATVQ